MVRWALKSGTAPAGRLRSSRSTRRGRTRCSAPPSWRSRPDHPLAKAAAENESGTRRTSSRNAARIGTAAAALETAEKLGFDTGIKAVHPLRFVVGGAGLRRQLHPDGLRHRRHLRLPGRTTSATSSSPTSTASPSRPVVKPADAGDDFAVTDTAYDGDGVMINSRFLDGLGHRGRLRRGRRAAGESRTRRQGRSPRARSTSACATG